jgi:hypothetical protein
MPKTPRKVLKNLLSYWYIMSHIPNQHLFQHLSVLNKFLRPTLCFTHKMSTYPLSLHFGTYLRYTMAHAACVADCDNNRLKVKKYEGIGLTCRSLLLIHLLCMEKQGNFCMLNFQESHFFHLINCQLSSSFCLDITDGILILPFHQ